MPITRRGPIKSPASPLFNRENHDVCVVSVKLMPLIPLLVPIRLTVGSARLFAKAGAIRKSLKLDIAIPVEVNPLWGIRKDFAAFIPRKQSCFSISHLADGLAACILRP